MATAVRVKPRALLLGGKDHNVPKQLTRYFDLIKHIHQDERVFSAPKETQIILVIRDWVSHGVIERVQDQLPGVPLVAARAGWSHMVTELVKRGLLPDGDPVEPEEDRVTAEDVEDAEEPAPRVRPQALPPINLDEIVRILGDLERLTREREEAFYESQAARETCDAADDRLSEIDEKLSRYRSVVSHLEMARDEISKLPGKL